MTRRSERSKRLSPQYQRRHVAESAPPPQYQRRHVTESAPPQTTTTKNIEKMDRIIIYNALFEMCQIKICQVISWTEISAEVWSPQCISAYIDPYKRADLLT